eukprot:TRINITY_DN97_c0_g1_i5.p1 TRINITY_DN97_c0_g1~~TRINITY_DN97_c0_g1_i5.p1  ORF type:complete len:214 (-),score=54.41 TRINITY_DN97_c0_g1_i5:43-684(-)
MNSLFLLSLFLCVTVTYSHLRVAHASPNAPAVDVYVDATKIFTGLTFKQVSEYEEVDDGKHTIVVTATGTTQAVINTTVEVLEFRAYTIAAIGLLPAISPLEFFDDARPAERGRSAVRFVHLSPDAPAVDVAVVGGPVLFRDIEYRESSHYIQVVAGTYNLEVRLARTETVVLRVPNVALTNTDVYSIFAEGLVKGTGAQALGAVVAQDVHDH